MVFTTVIYLRFLSVTIPIFAIGNYYKIKELFQDEKERFVLAFFTGCLISAVSLQAQTGKDSTKVARSYAINEVVVTGTRSETDVRHLPMTVSVVGRPQLEASQQTSVLPVLNSQVPGFSPLHVA